LTVSVANRTPSGLAIDGLPCVSIDHFRPELWAVTAPSVTPSNPTSQDTIVFRFTGPKGFIGVHGFAVQELPTGSRLTHTLSMDTRGSGMVLWLLASWPLHDALIEDALDNAAQKVGAPRQAPPWPVRVRVLRAILQAIRRRKGAT